MGRPSKPWYREQVGAWVARVGGVQYKLAEGKGLKAERAAYKALNKVIEDQGKAEASTGDISTRELCDRFLDHVQRTCKPISFEWYKRHLKNFLTAVGKTRLSNTVTPTMVDEWLDGRKWSQTTRHGFITAVKACYRWGFKKKKLIPGNPLADVEKPGIDRREVCLSPETVQRVLNAVDGDFKDLLVFWHETGARPNEAYSITASDVELAGSKIIMESKTSKRTRRKRVIVLTPVALEVVKRRMEAHPEGVIFTNRAGTAWTRHTVAHRFERLRKQLDLGSELTAESFRHTLCTDMLSQGHNTEVVAAVLGHSSSAMISKHYSHLIDRHDVLLKAVNATRHDETSNGQSESPSGPEVA
jgi:site-specific recombinase XerD